MVKRLGTIVGSDYACFAHNYKFTIIYSKGLQSLLTHLKNAVVIAESVQNMNLQEL